MYLSLLEETCLLSNRQDLHSIEIKLSSLRNDKEMAYAKNSAEVNQTIFFLHAVAVK